MVFGYSKHYFSCQCDICGTYRIVEEDDKKGIYNGAQAVRSLGWSFGKDGKTVKCSCCRKYRYNASRVKYRS